MSRTAGVPTRGDRNPRFELRTDEEQTICRYWGNQKKNIKRWGRFSSVGNQDSVAKGGRRSDICGRKIRRRNRRRRIWRKVGKWKFLASLWIVRAQYYGGSFHRPLVRSWRNRIISISIGKYVWPKSDGVEICPFCLLGNERVPERRRSSTKIAEWANGQKSKY